MSRFVVAVTGGIASGKSEACRYFERIGIVVADADAFARSLVERGQPALEAIVVRFGDGVLCADGNLDRAGLRRFVFDDEAARRDLEAILHPRIRDALRDACAAATSAYVIAAIPLLAEGGGRARYPWLDRILVVDATREAQVQRLLARDGGTREQAERVLAAQASREQRLAIADDVIENAGTPEALAHRVAELHAFYLRLVAAKS
ncbi:MAG TPA: dephospho-CoA kinase [Xanthomonadaceae bacterium]|jgi:dephospho-CoA kinase|nr:dephospho-CoA kinase [Xanthomonadaceae bacterium]